MIAEALCKLEQMAQAALQSKVVRIDEIPDKIAIQDRSGSLTWMDVPVSFQHKTNSMASFVEAVKRLKTEQMCSVWHRHGGITFRIEDHDPLREVNMSLTHTQVMESIAWMSEKVFDQKGFVRLCRHDLAGTGAEALAEIAAVMEFSSTESGHGRVAKDKESMGRSIEAEVNCGSELPESIQLAVRIYQEAGGVHQITCSVELDKRTMKFSIAPQPDEVDLALIAAHENIGNELCQELGDEIPVYYGTP